MLPNRRENVTTSVVWTSPSGTEQRLIVTYGFDHDRKIKEAFCASFKTSSDICALANDACILLSLLLQNGYAMSEVAAKLGENRQEGDSSGPPASLIGSIARRGAEIERGE